MAEHVIHVRAKKADVLRLLRSVPHVAVGGTPAAQVLMTRMGLQTLSLIKQAFVAKSHGGTDEAGDRWAKLDPKTIAYSRRHSGLPFPGSKRAVRAPSWMLTRPQRTRWWKLYQAFGGTRPKGRPYHAVGSRSDAAAKAWMILKSEGARTILGVYGSTPVLILRSTGALLNSLSPGIEPSEAPPPVPPPKPTGKGGESQQFRLSSASVIVGTNRRFAGVHHRGRPGRIPQRRLWPDPSRWPASWWNMILNQAKLGTIEIILDLLQRGVK